MTKPAAIAIKRANASQAARLTQIAHAAKSYWGYPSHWIELWHDQLHISPTFIDAHEVYVAIADDAILGFYALTGSGEKLQMEHMWVMPVAIGQGIGSVMFQHALKRATRLGAKIIEIEADPNAEGFYQKMGAETVGEVSYILEGQRRSLPLLQMLVPQENG
jgi:GNAT superfamily N-acetyltransferase